MVATWDSPHLRETSISNIEFTALQNLKAKLPSPQLRMIDFERDPTYSSFLSCTDLFYDPESPSLEPFRSIVPPSAPLCRPVAFKNFDFGRYNQRSICSAYDFFHHSSDETLAPHIHPLSPLLSEFKPERHWSQPRYSPARQDFPDGGIGNYLPYINFNDPTKPFPALQELFAQSLPDHRLLQRLILWDPSAFRQNLREPACTYHFIEFEQLLDELACLAGINVESKGSFDEIQECLSGLSKRLSVIQGLRIINILGRLAQLEWMIKQDLGHRLDEYLIHDERFMIGMQQSMRLGRAAVMEEEELQKGLGTFTESLKPLFGLDTEAGLGRTVAVGKELDKRLEPFSDSLEPSFGLDTKMGLDIEAVLETVGR